MAAVADREPIDFEAEGLLDACEGEAREARLELLTDLAADGAELEELRQAVATGRLALLPVERALAGEGPRYTAREIAEETGVELKALQRATRALGITVPDPDDRVLTEADLDEARRVRAFRDVGLPEEGMLQVARTIGMGTSRIAQANRELILRTLIQPGDSERDLALRFAAAARTMMPLIGPTLAYALQVHLLEQIRQDVIGTAEVDSGGVGGATDIAVCFADMVGFTKLGEQLDAEELGQVAGRMEELAAEVAEPPVQLVKLIGDAAMLGLDRRARPARRGPAAGRVRRGGGRGLPAAPRRRRSRGRARAGRRLVRQAGQPRQPDHRRGPARQRPRQRRGQGRGGGGALSLLVRGRAPSEGDRGAREAVPGPARRRRGRGRRRGRLGARR